MSKGFTEFLFAITILGIFIWGLYKFDDFLSNDKKIYSNQLGETFITGKDTLMIVKQHYWKSIFTLENGVEVSAGLVFKQKNIER